MTKRTWARRGVMAGLLLFLAGMLSPLQFSPATAADNGAWSATPIRKGNQTPRQFFFFEVSEGQTLRDAITITNASVTEQTLFVYGADAYNVQAGAGFALVPRNQEMTDVGSWVKVAKKEVRIPPNGKVNVPFTMTVPRDVAPGDHAGGIVTLEPVPEQTDQANSNIITQRALAVRIYARVAGPLTPSLSVQDVQVQAKPARLPFIGQQGGATVTYTVRNSGNVRITADRVITIKGLFGRTLHATDQGPIPEILPGSTVTLSESFAGMPVLDQITARVELTEESLSISTAGDATAWVISIPFLVLLLIVLVGIAFAIWWSRRGEGKGPDPMLDSPAQPLAGAGAGEVSAS